MNATTRPATRHLSPAEAARQLGVSAKALRLYEQRGLLAPFRNAAGWRCYGPAEMQRGTDIVALRTLGLSLAQVACVLQGQAASLAPALAAHQAVLEGRIRQLAGTVDQVRALRADLADGQAPAIGDVTRLLQSNGGLGVEFALPWPWGGELFRLRDIPRLNYIVGPLGSGKTRLAMRLAEVLPGAAFVGLERAGDGDAKARLAAEPALLARVDRAMAWLVDEGACASDALLALLVHLEAEGAGVLVVDLVEHGLNAATQHALAAHLRRRGAECRTLFMLTRSTTILDLAAVTEHEAIILCPANHSPPVRVTPYPGAQGYEAVATCLASPAVRARTEGVVARRPAQRA